jgi:hypothetical protein
VLLNPKWKSSSPSRKWLSKDDSNLKNIKRLASSKESPGSA